MGSTFGAIRSWKAGLLLEMLRGHVPGRILRALAYQVLLLGAPCQPADAATYYRVTDLGTLGGFNSEARAINDSGQIVGQSDTAENRKHAFLYSDGTMIDLGALPGGDFGVRLGPSSALAINASGQVVGYGYKNGALAAFLYSGGAITFLGLFEPSGINDAGQVAGTALLPGNHVSHAILYDLSEGKLIDLGTLNGGEYAFSAGYGINVHGDVVGVSQIAGGLDGHAVLYSAGTFKDLGTLGGPSSLAFAVNSARQVVGESLTASGGAMEHAFLYSEGTMIDLSTTPGSAIAINEAGQVIGLAAGAGYFLYDGGRVQPLTTLLHPDDADFIVAVNGINNLGQMVGAALRGDPLGPSHAALLTVSNDPLPPCYQVPVVATFTSIACRLDALRARVQAEPALHPFRAKLTNPLDKAIARHREAADFCAAADLKHTQRRLKKVVRAMVQFTDRLSSRPARNKIEPTLRDGLLTDGQLLADHAMTLRASPVCPDSVPE